MPESSIIRCWNTARELKTPIVAGSDAHAADCAGNLERVKELLLEIDFPEELVVNRSVDVLKSYLHKFRDSSGL